MIFKSESQLREYLLDKSANAVDATKDKILREFAENLNTFYSEYEPLEYIRTNKLAHSLEVTGVKRIGNYATAEIYFETPHYEHGEVLMKNGEYGISEKSDEWIQHNVMEGKYPHGDYPPARGTAIWTKSMRGLGKEKGIIKLLKQELKRQGL